MTKNKHGFTLIELVVVMAIIAILAALMVAAILAARNQATTTQRVGNVKTLETGLESWATKNSGKYPHAADPAALNTLLKTDGALSSEVSGVENINYYWFDDGSATTKATPVSYTHLTLPTILRV